MNNSKALLVPLLLAAAAAFAQERAIVKQVVVKAPPEAVWQAWTTSQGITSFFAPEAQVDPRVDGPFHIHFNPYAPAGLKGADDMRFLALQEGKMLSFTWNAPPHLPQVRGQHTHVTVRLKPAGAGETTVTLTHGGWGDGGQWDQAYDYFDRAWGNVLANLQKRFVTGPVDWKPFLAGLKKAEDEKAKATDASFQREKVLRLETIVNAPPDAVWQVIDPRAAIANRGTTLFSPVNFVEYEMVTYKVNLTNRFPERVRAQDQDLSEIIQLIPWSGGRTKVVSTMVGWGSGPEWDETFDIFRRGNDAHMRSIADSFAR